MGGKTGQSLQGSRTSVVCSSALLHLIAPVGRAAGPAGVRVKGPILPLDLVLQTGDPGVEGGAVHLDRLPRVVLVGEARALGQLAGRYHVAGGLHAGWRENMGWMVKAACIASCVVIYLAVVIQKLKRHASEVGADQPSPQVATHHLHANMRLEGRKHGELQVQVRMLCTIDRQCFLAHLR